MNESSPTPRSESARILRAAWEAAETQRTAGEHDAVRAVTNETVARLPQTPVGIPAYAPAHVEKNARLARARQRAFAALGAFYAEQAARAKPHSDPNTHDGRFADISNESLGQAIAELRVLLTADKSKELLDFYERLTSERIA